MHLSIPKSEKNLILLLVLLYCLTRLPLLAYMPLVKDEALYCIMVEEQAKSPSVIATFLGHPVSWKPGPFFLVYSFFSRLPLPIEMVYRLPSFLFGLATIPLLFRLLENCGLTRNMVFLSSAIFLMSLPSIYPNVTILFDTMNFFLVCGAFYLYTEKKHGDLRFLAAGLLAFAAFFIKLIVAFMIPVLAVAYLFFRDRSELKKPLFLLSLLATPAAFLLHYSILDSQGLARELFFSDIGGKFFSQAGLEGQVQVISGAFIIFLIGAGVWISLSFFGFARHWKENPFMTFWYALTIIPLLTGYFLIWYFLPVMPAVAYFAALMLLRWEGKEKPDLFFFIFFALASLMSLALIGGLYVYLHDDYIIEKEAGLMLTGKDDALVIGRYAPGIISYKMLTEIRDAGKPLDVGWITAQYPPEQEKVEEYIRDYNSDRYPIVQGSFSSLFTSNNTLRKDSNITDFGYLAIVGNYSIDIPGSTLLYNRSDILIYQVK